MKTKSIQSDNITSKQCQANIAPKRILNRINWILSIGEFKLFTMEEYFTKDKNQ